MALNKSPFNSDKFPQLWLITLINISISVCVGVSVCQCVTECVTVQHHLDVACTGTNPSLLWMLHYFLWSAIIVMMLPVVVAVISSR